MKRLPRHKKNKDVGMKQTVFSDTILIEQEDARSFAEGEEVRDLRCILLFTIFFLASICFSG